MIKNIFFDFDGTLADTSFAIIKTTVASFEHLGLEAPAPEYIKSCIGLSLRSAAEVYPGLSEDRYDEFESVYHSFFDQYITDNVVLYPGVSELLHALKEQGYRLAIATSRGINSLKYLTQTLGIADCFEALSTIECVASPKPAPDTVLYLFDKMGVGPQDTLVVGDTSFDIQMGRNAQCRTCGVSYGNHSADMLVSASADYVIDDFSKLSEVLESLK